MAGLSIPAEAAWPLVFLGVAVFWAVAVSQIGAGLRRGTSSPAPMAAMAVAVSAVAVLAVLAAGAALPQGTTAGDAGAGPATGCGALRATPVFGFGIEDASRVDVGCDEGGRRS